MWQGDVTLLGGHHKNPRGRWWCLKLDASSGMGWRRKWQPTPVFLPGESCLSDLQSQTQLKQLSMHACIREGDGSPLQYSCLENPRDRGAWWAAIYGVSQSQTWPKWLSSSNSRSSGMERIVKASIYLERMQKGSWVFSFQMTDDSSTGELLSVSRRGYTPMSKAHQLRRGWIEKMAMWMLQVSKIRVVWA